MLTKRVATLGPSTDALSLNDLAKLLSLVDGVRINLAHATLEEVEKRIAAVRRYEAETRRHIAVVVDLRGSSVRVGKVPPLYVKEGDVVSFRLAQASNGSFIPIPAKTFFQVLEPGDVVLMLDGKLRLKIRQVSSNAATATAESEGVVETGKAAVVEGKNYDLPIPSEDDVVALRRISHLSHEVDYVSVSLVRNCRDVEAARAVLEELGFTSSLMTKIETKSAVENLEELIRCSDYVVVARGDLGLHYGLETLPLVQKRVVETCITHGKPVAVATQLLDSMQNSPTPTRAEVNDVFTTASMGVDSLWLTGETASGRYPISAAYWLAKILSSLYYNVAQTPRPQNTRDQFAKGLVEMARDLEAKILVYSMTGTLAKRIAKFRPLGEVYVGTPDLKIARTLALVWGLRPIHLPAENYEEGLEELIETAGVPPFVATYGIKGGTHLVKVKFQR